MSVRLVDGRASVAIPLKKDQSRDVRGIDFTQLDSSAAATYFVHWQCSDPSDLQTIPDMGLLLFARAGVPFFADERAGFVEEHRGHFGKAFAATDRWVGFCESQCSKFDSGFVKLDPQSRKSERDRQQQETPPNTWLNATAISKRIGSGDEAI
ncbi:hypothetical protein SH501x_000744 [Pirellulaceae bacterium SH501]